MDNARQILDEGYHGEFDSEGDFAYYWTNDVNGTEIPSRRVATPHC